MLKRPLHHQHVAQLVDEGLRVGLFDASAGLPLGDEGLDTSWGGH